MLCIDRLKYHYYDEEFLSLIKDCSKKIHDFGFTLCYTGNYSMYTCICNWNEVENSLFLSIGMWIMISSLYHNNINKAINPWANKKMGYLIKELFERNLKIKVHKFV